MESDIEKMYLSLNQLLVDICKFLSSDKLGALSPKDKKIADSLINRSKVQLQEIAKIQQSSSNDEYVDMDSKKVLVIEEGEGKNNIYSSVDDMSANVEVMLIEEAEYLYKDLPAREASQDVKYGSISMRRKFLLFDKMKRVYATLHNQWLIIYCTDKDLKPMCTFDLKGYEARETDSDKSSNFELVSTSPDKKVYYFTALTRKDMLQWVVHINRCHDAAIIHSKELELKQNRELTNENDDAEEHYDSVIPQNNFKQNVEEDEDIYLELDDIMNPNLQNNNTIAPTKVPAEKDDKPPLPGRRPIKKNVSIPVTSPVVKPLSPPHDDSDESLASYYDIGTEQTTEIQNICIGSIDDSFSEGEDCTYEAFVDVKDAVDRLKSQNVKHAESKIINVTNEKTISKPPILLVKPKVKHKPAVAKKPVALTRSNS